MENVASLVSNFLGVFVVAAALVYGYAFRLKLSRELNQSQQSHDLNLFRSLSGVGPTLSSMAANIIAEEIDSRRTSSKYLVAGTIGALKSTSTGGSDEAPAAYRKTLSEALARKFKRRGFFGLFRSPQARNFDWQRVDMSDSYLVRFSGDSCDFWGANFSKSILKESSFRSAALRSSKLHGSDLSNVDFTEANLKKANLTRATLCRTNFERADLSGADLTGAIVEKSRFANAKFDSETALPDGLDPESAGMVKQ